ncbi:hypothetical protein D3C85_1776760 [compost metagenome]
MYPVDTTIRFRQRAVFAVTELAATFQLFVGVPVARGPGQRLAFNKTSGFALGAFFFHSNRGERLALGFSVRRGGYAADGQGQ